MLLIKHYNCGRRKHGPLQEFKKSMWLRSRVQKSDTCVATGLDMGQSTQNPAFCVKNFVLYAKSKQEYQNPILWICVIFFFF